MSTAELGLGLIWYVVFIVSLTFHEAAHGLAALRLGDTTAHDAGLVTLDPLTHIRRSPLGTVIVPIVSFLAGGWMIGWASTPYDSSWAHANRKKAALMALAGPAANLILILLAALLIRGGMLLGTLDEPERVSFTRITVAHSPGFADGLAVFLSVLFSLNIILLVFNLLPIPPLDGGGVLPLFLGYRAAGQYGTFMSQPGFQLIGLIIAWRLMDYILGPVWFLVINLLYP
jgi:Zn-dependent protease